jgi:glycosyltransferase involved in cell wall biosynthesis
LPALEALASGLPSVLTRIPSYGSFSDPCDYAAFVPADDAEAMAAGICALVQNGKERERLVRRGLEVASHFSYEKVADKLEACLSRG